jgi:hypothetical protein
VRTGRSGLILHPFLLSLYFVVFLVGANMGEIVVMDAIPPAAVIVGVSVLLWILARRVSGNPMAAGIAISILVFSFFTYGRVHDFLLSHRSPLQSQKILFPAWVLLTGLLVYLAFRLKRREVLRSITVAANVFAIALFAMPIISIAGYAARRQTPTVQIEGKSAVVAAAAIRKQINPLAGVRLRDDATMPDVYYIILDGYGRNDMLAKHFGYDNGAFTAFLEQKGFFVADRSTSNYAFTALSLSSSLNAAYLNPLADLLGDRTNDIHPLQDLIRVNAVTETFRAGGYRIIQVGSWWEVKSSDSVAQPRARYSFLNEFNIVLVSTSILSMIDGQLLAPLVRKRVLDSFTAVEQAATLPGRKFVFAHILSPHPPYLFGRDGTPLGSVKSIFRRVDTRSGFLDQSIFVTTRIRQTIERVLASSTRKPIIILQSDHGFGTVWSAAVAGVGAPTEKFLQAQFGILNAFLVPAELRPALYNSISPVNSFRVIMNYLSDARLPLLEDRSFFSTFIAPYRFREVTETVRAP